MRWFRAFILFAGESKEKNMDNFKRFVELNREKLYANSVKADDISVNDEWMQENQWDEIYEREEKIGCTLQKYKKL